jgi:flagellar biosynthesis chaperone FliJ
MSLSNSSVGFTGIKYKAGRNFGGAKKGDVNYVIFKPEDMKITEHTKFSIKTYHGSQASFDHFDHSFMGSGEGAQAYGWGTYVSEVEGIAKAYAKQNAAKHGMPREYKIAQTRLNHAKFEYDKVQRRYDNSKAYIDSLKEDLQNYRESMARRKEKVAYFAQNNMPETVDKLLKQIKRAEDTIKFTENDINMRTNDLEGWKPKLEEVKKKYEEEQKKFDAIPKPQIERNLYSVDIPDDTGENYLGWDEKMTPRMRDIRKEILEDNGYKLVDSDDMRDYFEDRDGKEYELFKEQYKTGGTFYEELAQLLHSQKLASLALKEYGFDGVKVIADRNTGGNKEGKMLWIQTATLGMQRTDRRLLWMLSIAATIFVSL